MAHQLVHQLINQLVNKKLTALPFNSGVGQDNKQRYPQRGDAKRSRVCEAAG